MRNRVSLILLLTVATYFLLMQVIPYLMIAQGSLTVDFGFTFYPWQFTPMFALAGLLGFYDRSLFKGIGWIIGLRLLTNFFLWQATGESRWMVYGTLPTILISMIACLWAARFARESNSRFLLGGALLASPTLYFLVSNFQVWLVGGGWGYTSDLNGLIQSYLFGLPFYRNEILSTIGFYLLMEWCNNRLVSPNEQLAAEPATETVVSKQS